MSEAKEQPETPRPTATDEEKRADGWHRFDQEPIVIPSDGQVRWVEDGQGWYKLLPGEGPQQW